MAMTRSVARAWASDDDIGTPVGIGVAEGAVVVAASAALAVLIPPADPDWRFAVVALAVGGFAAATAGLRSVAAIVLLAWLVVNGFLVDRFGVLAWHGWPDVVRAVLLIAAGAVGLGIGIARRRLRPHA
jgi:MFS family permease